MWVREKNKSREKVEKRQIKNTEELIILIFKGVKKTNMYWN